MAISKSHLFIKLCSGSSSSSNDVCNDADGDSRDCLYNFKAQIIVGKILSRFYCHSLAVSIFYCLTRSAGSNGLVFEFVGGST